MLVREFFAKNKTVIMNQPPYSSDLAPADFFPLPKTEDTDERKQFCYDGRDKRKIETGVILCFRSDSRIEKKTLI